MTTRINYVRFVKPERAALTIDPQDVKDLVEKFDTDRPSYCFLNELEDNIGKVAKEKTKCRCGTQSYGNAKFCRECGSKLDKKSLGAGIRLTSIDWHDEDYETDAANTFFPFFVKHVVPCLQGYAECAVEFGDVNNDDELEKERVAHFTITDGRIDWCEIELHQGADAPVFTAEYPYDDSSDDDR